MYVFTKSKTFYRFLLLQILFVTGFYTLYWFEFVTLSIVSFSAFLTLFLSIDLFLYYKFVKEMDDIVDQVANVVAGKPFVPVNIYSKDEFGLIAHFFNDITSNLKKISNVIKEEERMSAELNIAASIQRSVLPNSILKIPNFDIVCKTRPSEEIGGDSFDLVEIDSDYLFYIGDVTGHGAPAGLIMMIVNTLFDVLNSDFPDCKDLAVNINHILKPRVNSTMFMTCNFLQYNPNNNYIEYAPCGHEHLIIYRANEGVCEVIPAGGIALAMADDISAIIEKKKIELEENDILCLYSDGITEAMNQDGELFGLENLVATIKKYGHLNDSMKIFDSVAKDISKFTNKTIQIDDMTLLILRYSVGFDSNESQLLTKWDVE